MGRRLAPPGGADTIHCSVPDVNPGASVPLYLSLRVLHPGTAAFSATVYSASDPNPDNNTMSDPITANQREEDLTVGVQGIPNPVLVGDELTIRSVITNYGPDDAYSPPNGMGCRWTSCCRRN